jgi:hypothetical protein
MSNYNKLECLSLTVFSSLALYFQVKLGAYPWAALRLAQTMCANIILGWKKVTMTYTYLPVHTHTHTHTLIHTHTHSYTQAYYDKQLITAIKSFIVLVECLVTKATKMAIASDFRFDIF